MRVTRHALFPRPSVAKLLTVLAFAAALTTSDARGLAAQDAGSPPALRSSESVREAVRLREAGDLAGAARVLQERVAGEPGDAEAFRMLAQTLYWMGERDSARATYEAALASHPEDAELRLGYGRMLVETRFDGRAREVLLPAAEIPSTAARAETLLGTSAYWNGDFTRAVGHFRKALRADSSAADARRQWREIASATAGWLRLGTSARHDDQPLDHIAPEIELGGFLTPLWSVRVRGDASWYRPDPDPTRSLLGAAVTLRGYLPSLRLDAGASGGFVRRGSVSPNTDWTGAVTARVRLTGHASLGVRGERKPYFLTRSSLATNVMIEEEALSFALDHPKGWLGEASYARQRYSDRNTIESAYAWLLAPLVRGSGFVLQGGYAIGAQHAQESRFVLADSTQAVPPGHPLFDPSGRYAPYYTPDHLISNSALAAMEFRMSGGGKLRLDASYAVHARDDAPVLEVTGAPPTVTLSSFRRSFSPWSIRGSLERGIGPGLTLYANAEHARTVFYSTTSGSIQFIYRFTSAAHRRVDRF